MLDKNTIEIIIKKINNFQHHTGEDILNEFDIMIANEVQSSEYYDSIYKLFPICRRTYSDVHYKIKDTYYDVFIYEDEQIKSERMYQLVLCDNYAEVLKFKQDEYNNRKYVSRFSLIYNRIHSFYDGMVIVVETKEGRSEEPYEEL